MAPRNMQPEMIFQNEVIALTHDRHLWVMVMNPARFNQRVAGNKGFPDLLVIGPGGALYRELKTMNGMGPGGGLRPDQTVWRDRLLAGGQDWAVWTPHDLETGRIEQQLAAIEVPGEHSNEWALVQLGIPAAPSTAEDAAAHDSGGDQAPMNGPSPLADLGAFLVTAFSSAR